MEGEVWLKGQRMTPQTPEEAIRSQIAYVSEDRKGSGLILHQSIKKNMTLASLVSGRNALTHHAGLLSRVQSVQEDQVAQSWVRDLRVRCSGLDQAVGELSGGNQQKVVLAKWLMTSPQVLFLDEPTRGIDIGAKVEIYSLINQLAHRGMGIMMASSEMPELMGLCHRILVLREGRASAEFTAECVTQEEIMRAASL